MPTLELLREGRLVIDTAEVARHFDTTRRLLGGAGSISELAVLRVHHGEGTTGVRVQELNSQLRATIYNITLC